MYKEAHNFRMGRRKRGKMDTGSPTYDIEPKTSRLHDESGSNYIKFSFLDLNEREISSSFKRFQALSFGKQYMQTLFHFYDSTLSFDLMGT